MYLLFLSLEMRLFHKEERCYICTEDDDLRVGCVCLFGFILVYKIIYFTYNHNKQRKAEPREPAQNHEISLNISEPESFPLKLPDTMITLRCVERALGLNC